MNWCQPHWNKLRETLASKGLAHLGAKNGEELVENLQKESTGGESEFDPLWGCWMHINQFMLESPALNGRILQCPFCILVEDGRPELVDQWLDGATEEAVIEARRRKLIPGAQ